LNTNRHSLPRTFNLALVLVGSLWIVASGNLAARAAQGIINRLNLPVFDGLLRQSFFLFLLLWGFSTIQWITTRTSSDMRSTNALPERPTVREEWKRGAALGWGMLILAVLPMALTGSLHPDFAPELSNWGLALISLATIAVSTLALEVAFRGFIFKRLIAATSPVAATVLLSLFYAILSGYDPNATPRSVVITFFLAVLFCIAYLRTHALWLGWGIHFAWNAAMAVLFGLPIASNSVYNDLVFTSVSGPDWLTGGPYGPQGAILTMFVVLAGIVVLYRISRTYEWNYTHPPIVAAGYPMDIAPPPAHTAMETAAAPPPLVQILGTTPTAASTLPIIDDHLRREPVAEALPTDPAS
jgi:membrane protease YdiL (CAAX protease family)